METVFTAVSDIISTGRGDWVRKERVGLCGGGVQQKCILIGLDLNTVLSAHSGPPQHPEVKTKTGMSKIFHGCKTHCTGMKKQRAAALPSVLRVHVVKQCLLGNPEVI